jgi:hypothetical protein
VTEEEHWNAHKSIGVELDMLWSRTEDLAEKLAEVTKALVSADLDLAERIAVFERPWRGEETIQVVDNGDGTVSPEPAQWRRFMRVFTGRAVK